MFERAVGDDQLAKDVDAMEFFFLNLFACRFAEVERKMSLPWPQCLILHGSLNFNDARPVANIEKRIGKCTSCFIQRYFDEL